METQTTQPRVADYIRPLTSRWWLIVVAVVVAAGGVYAYYARKPNVYSASTLVFYQDPGDPVTGLPSAQSTDRTVQNEASLLASDENANVVARSIHYSGTGQDLLQQVSVTSKTGEDFLQVSATAGTAEQSAAIANAFAARFVSLLNGAYTTRIARALATSQTQLSQLRGGAASDTQRANLLDQINRLQLALKVPTTVGQQINAAVPPSSPSAPKPVRNALYALLIALVASIALAYGLERFDRRFKHPDELEAAYGSPLLAVLPHAHQPAPLLGGEPVLGGDFREPFRALRTNVELASIDDPPRTIVVSSAVPGEGKSTVVRNLALAFCEAGRRVAVVDLDLRHPALGALFGASFGPGMTDVLRHQVTLDDATLKISADLPAFDELAGLDGAHHQVGSTPNGRNGNSPRAAGVSLVLGGARPANPPAVLASVRLTEVLDELRERHDVVLIDSAPVLAVTDTVPLLRYADATLFVGRLGVTTRDTAKRLVAFLERVPDISVLGIVANDLPRLEAGGYGHGYGYGYGEQEREPKARGRRRKAAEQPKQKV